MLYSTPNVRQTAAKVTPGLKDRRSPVNLEKEFFESSAQPIRPTARE
jgi:hypothetical protein